MVARAGSAGAMPTSSRRSSPSVAPSPSSTTAGTNPTPTTSNSRALWKFARAFTIGRSRRCDVVIPTTAKTRTVSKLHARVVPVRDSADAAEKPTRWLLQDLGAMNGTSLNGADAPPGGSVELRHGDELVLASAMRYGARLSLALLHVDCSVLVLKLEDDGDAEDPAAAATALPVPAVTTTSSSSSSRNASPIERRLDPTAAAAAAAVVDVGAGFRTPPPRATRPPVGRHTSSTVATKRDRQHRDAERRRARSDSNELMEDVGEDADSGQQRKRSRRLEELDDQDRCMMCPICFEYYHASVTLPCSHTFCGMCVSSWFRSSLSCPQCRTDVTSLPVRNRALDDLIHRLVGETESYKALVAKRMRMQLEGERAEPHAEPTILSPSSVFSAPGSYRNQFLSDPVGGNSAFTAASMTGGAACTSTSNSGSRSTAPLPNVFTRWKQEEIARVRSILAKQFGETRLQTCRRMGLTDASMKQASISQTAIAMQNVLLDWWPYERVRDEGSSRLQIFLHFG